MDEIEIMQIQQSENEEFLYTEKSHAESLVIWQILMDGSLADIIFAELEPRYFMDQAYRDGFRTMKALWKKGQYTPATAWDALGGQKLAYRDVLSPAMRSTYCVNRKPLEEGMRSCIHFIKERYVNDQLSLNFDSTKAVELVSLLSEYKSDNRELTAENYDGVVAELVARDLSVIKTPYGIVNRTINGVRKNEYTIIAARPSVGKSVFLEEMFWQAPGQGMKALFISIEMSQEMILKRHIMRSEGVDLFREEVSPIERAELYRKVGDLLGENRIVTGNFTVKQIEKHITEIQPDVVLIDYLQLISDSDRQLKEYERVTKVTKQLAQLRNTYNIALMVASQYSRIDGIQPTLSDLRSSGQIEQDADVVLSLWKLNNKADLDGTKTVYIDCLKNRNGQTFGNYITKEKQGKTITDVVENEFSLTFNPSRITFV